MTYVNEPRKRVPVAWEGDVAVAGAGISGVFAAVAAGRAGAKTLLIERFGCLGGNIGPGMIWGGSLFGEADYTLPGGLAGIAREFRQRLESRLGDPKAHFARIASAASWLCSQMAREASVELMLSATAADPVIEKGLVRGLCVETASGRVAVHAKVTVDATGTAELAARAGAPMIKHMPPKPSYAPIVRPRYLNPDYPEWNEAGLISLVANVDFAAYDAFMKPRITPTAEVERWGREHDVWTKSPMANVLFQAFQAGEYDPTRELAPNVKLWTDGGVDNYGNGVGALRTQALGGVNIDDWRHVTLIEAELRGATHTLVEVYRKYVPGFASAYVLCMAPFLGTRGGPCIAAEHVLTPEESIVGARFDDVLYVNVHEGEHGGAKAGYDFPYRCLLPKGLDGLLVTGRGAGYERRAHDPSGIRARPSMMVLGQVTGEAAALAAARGETTRNLNVKELQRLLVQRGINLGDADRLRALGVG